MVEHMTLVAVPVIAVAGEFDATRADIEVTPSGPIEWRVLESDQAPPAAEIVEVLLERATRALDDLADIDLGHLDADTAEAFVIGTERLRRTAEAATIRITGHIDRVQPFRSAGFFTTTAYLKHRLQLAGPEAFQRVQMARQSRVLERWASGHAAGAIGHAQFRLMARIATNPRIAPEQLQEGSIELWCDALDCSFGEFERRARMWEALADPVGALERAERAVQRRSVHVTPLLSGGWGLTGRLADVGGAEFNEIFAHFVDCSEEHRRCDALVAMARAAAANGSGVGAEPTVNFIIDHDTARSVIVDEPIDHSIGWRAHGNTVPRNGGPLCRTHNRDQRTGLPGRPITRRHLAHLQPERQRNPLTQSGLPSAASPLICCPLPIVRSCVHGSRPPTPGPDPAATNDVIASR